MGKGEGEEMSKGEGEEGVSEEGRLSGRRRELKAEK
jgi:hypothetical protein